MLVGIISGGTAFGLTGIYGNTSRNLISKSSTPNGYKNYSYQFDDDGFPTVIYVEFLLMRILPQNMLTIKSIH